MSYDLHLVRALPDDQQELEDELNPGPIDPAKEAEKHRLANALLRFDPGLEMAPFEFAGLAKLENVDEAEARRRYRHIELNTGDYSGIQISLWDDSADISFPYWHSGEQAQSVMRRVWDYLEVLAKWGGFLVFDPQLDRLIDLGTDFAAVFQNYSNA